VAAAGDDADLLGVRAYVLFSAALVAGVALRPTSGNPD
jgi:hypothetical protein